jgi:SSS family solute:Na+ symporter
LRSPAAVEYVAAGRALTLPQFVATLVVTWYGGILGIAESASYFGVGTWLLLGVPYYLFGTLYALRLAGRVRQEDAVSIPERFLACFGPLSSKVAAALVVLLGVPAAHVLMLGVLVTSATPLPLSAGVAIAAAASSLAFVRGGLLADVRASLLAFPVTYAGFVTIVAVCVARHPPAPTLGPLLAGALGRLDGGQGPLTVLTFFLLGAWTLVDPGFHQRVAAAASPGLARRGVLAAVGCWALFDLLSITAGLYSVALVQPTPANPLLLFPALADAVLPPGAKGLFLAATAATVLNASVGYALVSGSSIGRDLMGGGTKKARWGVVAACAVAAVLALAVQSVVQLWYSWAGCVVGALLTPFLVAYSRGRRRLPDAAVAVSAACGFVAGAGAMAYGMATDNLTLTFELPGVGTTSLGTLLPSWAVSSLTLALARHARKEPRA